MTAYNYYHVGGSLRYKHPTYIERKADRELYEGLKKGELCYVLNSRQMGKSSLRVRMMKTLKEEGIKCASIDMGRLGSFVTPEEWYGGIVSELWRGFSLSTEVDGDRIWWQQQGWLSPVLRLSRFIEDILFAKFSQNIVIFIDEIDNIIKINFKDDFFTFIRTCYNQRVDNPEYARLTFCLLGVATPSNLIQDKRRTPFNVGRAIELTGFTLEEARLPLVEGLKETADNPERVLEEVLYWTGGQPFLTQKLCQLIVQEAESKCFNIQQLIQKHVIDNWEVQDEPEHLRTIRDRILSDEYRAVRLLELYKQVLQYDGSTTHHDSDEVELRLSGLVVKQEGIIRVYNPIYQQVFNLNWVENKLASLWLFFQNPGRGKDIPIPSPSFPDLTKFLWFCAVLLVVSALSLLCSYHWFSSEPWQKEFGGNGNGAIIEFSRSVLFAIGAIYLLGVVWREEARELVRGSRLSIKRWQRGIVIVGISIFITSLIYHSLIGPFNLQRDYPNYTEFFKDFWLPYLVYLPYTIINYNIFALAWVSISLYGAVQDLKQNLARTNYLQERLTQIQDYFEDKLFDTSFVENMVWQEFQQFSLNFMSMISRYTILFLCIGIIVLFESNWGLKTLADVAKQYQIFAYLFNVMPLAMILWGFSHYHAAFRKASLCLFCLHCDYKRFERENGISELLRNIVNSHFNLYVVLAIISVYFIFVVAANFMN